MTITHKFLLKVKHDKGYVEFTTWATTEAAAREIVMAAERCPPSAIRRVRAVDEHGFEMLAGKPCERRVLRLPADAVRVSDFPGYRVSASKVPTRYEVRFDNRWRRVFTTAHTGLRYVVCDSLNVQLNFPEDLQCAQKTQNA